MKGGEILRFRHFFILGLMVGATMFLPDYAFAEKNEYSGKQNSHNASVQASPSVKTDNPTIQTNVPEKAKNVKPLEKTVVIPEPAIKNQDRVKQQPSKMTPQQAASKKPAQAPQNLPDQAKGNVQSSIKKTEKNVTARGSEKVEAVQGNNRGLVKNKPNPKNGAGNSAVHSFHHNDTEVKNKAQSARLVNKLEPLGEGSHSSVSKKENSSEPLVTKTPQKEGNKAPSSKGEIPKVSQVTNPTQRTNGTGGQSKDRVSQGLSTISLMDKWFEWNKYHEIQFVQPYFSLHLLFNNQWVNAPPSPPPQETPLLKTVYRS